MDQLTEIMACKAGAAAYKAGKERAPALNQSFIAQVCTSDVDTTILLTQYIHGWTVARAARIAIEVGMHDMPSIRELAAIEAA